MGKNGGEYVNKLFNQYCNSIGIDLHTDYENVSDDQYKCFLMWLLENKGRVALYKNYLEYLNVLDRPLIELEKGKFDTLGLEDAILVSPYANTLGLYDSQIVIKDYNAYIISRVRSDLFGKQIEEETIVDHNPFDIDRIKKWDMFVKTTGVDISVGVYGKKNDKDYGRKITLISNLRNSLGEDYILDYETIGEEFFASLNKKSKTLIKERKITKTR